MVKKIKQTKKFKIKKDPFAEREAQKYENPIPSREFILEFLAERGRPATIEELIAELVLENSEQQEALRRRLIAMTRDGQLLKNRGNVYGPLASMELIAGRVIGHKDGFGFVVPDDGEDDLFLSPRQMRNVFHGDRVLARVANIDSRGRREGIIIEILERNTQQIVGRLFTESGASYVESANQRITQMILIPPDELHGAKNGQIVVAAITGQPTKFSRPLGQIIEILGDHMAPGMEINVAIRNHDLPYQWPDEVTDAASRFPAHILPEEITERMDLRHLAFVTIDGEDAKDFDDAVYCIARSQGGWELYVAIADVSHYVTPNSALDGEAYKRGNSVYFPGRVIPMLPETLSNNLCSLKSNVDRLVVVCHMIIHPSGRITRFQFYEAVIHSQARLTYKEVHLMIEKNDKRVQGQYKNLLSYLKSLYELFHVLRKARSSRGAIDFDLPETKIIFGDKRKIEKIIPYERFDSHRVIEESMLCANICAARLLQKHKHPGLYRVHEGPTEEKLFDLQRFLQELGLKMPAHRQPVPADYAHILRVIETRPDSHLIQTMLLRSMSQAVYSPENKGHFGLAYEAYAHFTSPIRRYPDLLIHRAIKHVLHKEKYIEEMQSLVRAGEHCSMTERRADDATNEAIDWLKCEFMMDKVGKEFLGTVCSVTGFGLFVELKDIYVEGLIHISTLPRDYYQFDPVKHALIGARSKRKFQIGDEVFVQVASVNVDQREINFVLNEPLKNNVIQENKTKKMKQNNNNKKHKQSRKSGRKK